MGRFTGISRSRKWQGRPVFAATYVRAAIDRSGGALAVLPFERAEDADESAFVSAEETRAAQRCTLPQRRELAGAVPVDQSGVDVARTRDRGSVAKQIRHLRCDLRDRRARFAFGPRGRKRGEIDRADEGSVPGAEVLGRDVFACDGPEIVIDVRG